jgi:hypothetical protein
MVVYRRFTPYLSDIASDWLTYVPHYPLQSEGKKAA